MGTEVSAKYRGAFCEAKVKKIVRSVKCKVSFRILNNEYFDFMDKGEWISWEMQGKSKVRTSHSSFQQIYLKETLSSIVVTDDTIVKGSLKVRSSICHYNEHFLLFLMF